MKGFDFFSFENLCNFLFSIVRYLTDNMEVVSLGALARLVTTHDVPGIHEFTVRHLSNFLGLVPVDTGNRCFYAYYISGKKISPIPESFLPGLLQYLAKIWPKFFLDTFFFQNPFTAILTL